VPPPLASDVRDEAITVCSHNGATSTLTKPALYTSMTGKLVKRSSHTHKLKGYAMSPSMSEYVERCNRLNLKINGAVVRIIARQTHEDTNWYDAMSCTVEGCDNH
jgi:hypothetical protein